MKTVAIFAFVCMSLHLAPGAEPSEFEVRLAASSPDAATQEFFLPARSGADPEDLCGADRAAGCDGG